MWPFRDPPPPPPEPPRPRYLDELTRYYERALVRDLGPVCGVPTTNLENWPDERLRWAVRRILEIAEEE